MFKRIKKKVIKWTSDFSKNQLLLLIVGEENINWLDAYNLK